jgi:hypothetical protein
MRADMQRPGCMRSFEITDTACGPNPHPASAQDSSLHLMRTRSKNRSRWSCEGSSERSLHLASKSKSTSVWSSSRYPSISCGLIGAESDNLGRNRGKTLAVTGLKRRADPLPSVCSSCVDRESAVHGLRRINFLMLSFDNLASTGELSAAD